MQETEAVLNARREMEICNACRYCEGFCAVFPAVTLRREFSTGDLSYLANLCHGCRGCYYACQYAPPHEWGINVPRTLAEVRAETYAEYAWPQPLAKAFERNGVVVSVVVALSIALMLLIAMAISAPGQFFAARPMAAGAFYSVIPLWAMQIVGIGSFGFSLFALWKGACNFWKDAGAKQSITITAIAIAAWDAVTLKNLGGGGDGCNDNSEAFSKRRRHLHHAMAGGFMLCFAATTTGFIYHSFLGWEAPYAFTSLPVALGTIGGVLLTVGTVGLFAMKLVEDPMPVVRRLLGGDVAMLVLLAATAITGLFLLAVRATGAMPIAMAIHLGFILALFMLLPYSKMVHGVYRSAALLRRAVERDMKPLGGE